MRGETHTHMHFFLWYYTTGLLGVLRLAGNLLRYVAHRFNLTGLLATLVSPWKRDVTFQNWRGFQPLRFLHALINNAIVRFLGLIVRSVVIAAGSVALTLAALGAAGGVVLAVLAPPFLLGGAWALAAATSPLVGAAAFGLSLATVLVALYGWRDHVVRHTDYALIPDKAPWRERVAARLGLAPADLPEDFFVAPESRKPWLIGRTIDPELFEQAWRLEAERFLEERTEARFWDWARLKRAPRIGRYWSYAYTPLLDRYSTDLTEHDFSSYSEHRPIGREKVIELLSLALTRPGERSALLVGEPGIGKRSVIHALARLIRENQYADPALADARVVMFDLGQAFSDARSAGTDPKTLLRDILEQAVYAGNIVLVIENVELYLNPESELAVGEVLHEYLQYPACRMIGLMTTEAYRTIGQHQIPALKYFETITLAEPSQDDVIRILLDTFRELEQKRPIFTLQALETIYTAAERYNWEAPFPERALDLAQAVLAYWQQHPEAPQVTRELVEDFLEAKSGIPMGEATAAERDTLLHLEDRLHERVVGQHEAIKQIAEAFRKVRSGLGDAKKPIGSFLFLGPTGVGKTETAKALAAVYFGAEERMVRLDMSEFQTPQSVTELIGSAELNVEGRLTTLIKEQPYAILLLDELEKAYPKALDLFLQILDEGFVTDGFGHRVSFRNTIIIATSNAGAAFIREAALSGKPMDAIEDELMSRIVAEGLFRPEFLNRFDGVVLFQSLTEAEMAQVTRLKLEAFAEKLYAEKKITMTFTDEAVRAIIERGYKPEYGARSINRYIADVVEDATVKRLLRGDLAAGATVTITPADLERG